MSKPSLLGGWLFAPMVYLLLVLLSSSLMLIIYVMTVVLPETRSQLLANSQAFSVQWYISFVTTVLIWMYTFWLLLLYGKRSRRFPKHFIIWLLLMLLLALKTFAFAPVSDAIALRNLFITLLGAALFVPYIKRSERVKKTFIEP
ncbi:DUF2569 domain-containing protein [Enterobacillus tribolii]|uniref:Uncharacterized protein DUF2569 n=1 Tax=Enterobacillus tribolii TaxID=1487935 RepID=A0A370R3X2_9GAMM|nr:DUF2569 domain-containing protein [Enterobacillus tribolii]MBW7984389.1 DUF2569 domain-containing protein [Enterobacillus tribolii]RDK97128.1 uncharacterized protein DUF2569 [Enterobacillus tribolii]